MTLAVNPVSQLVQKVDAEVSAALAAAEVAVPEIGNALEKAKLDAK